MVKEASGNRNHEGDNQYKRLVLFRSVSMYLNIRGPKNNCGGIEDGKEEASAILSLLLAFLNPLVFISYHSSIYTSGHPKLSNPLLSSCCQHIYTPL